MKKIILIIATLIFGAISLTASPADSVYEYRLENGMSVFLLEDTSTPLIRIEFTTRAGFSSQTEKTSGFFKLYSRVLTKSLPQITFDDVQCNSDSTRYITTIPSSKLEKTLSLLSEGALNPQFSDETIKNELNKLKTEVKENYESMSGFINASIDSRVFSDAPWKHDSGIYPPVFNGTTVKNARAILNMISERWYTPQNSAIFISGNFNSIQMKELINYHFGRFYSTYKTPVEKNQEPVITHKKYVIHNPEFSDELTQIVVQYLDLNHEECDIASLLLNNNYSFFKYNLLSKEELNIPGDEYIDASSAYKRDRARLIIQTLIQPPENKKIKTNSLKQTEMFLSEVKQSMGQTNTAEFLAAKQIATSNMRLLTESSTSFMENLSAYWAIEPYDTYKIETITTPEKSITTGNLLSKAPKYDEVSIPTLTYKLKNEEPFVFVIINSNDFKNLKKEYLNAGYEEINVNNASWKNQSIFAELNRTNGTEQINTNVIESSSDNDFYKKNLQAIKEYDLKNGITLITKKNENSNDITIIVSIRGGKLNTCTNHGLEEVMINILSNNIQREFFTNQQKGLISGSPTINWQCELTTSHLTIQCSKEDFTNVCSCISNAIIYSDIIPSTADRSVSNRQYRKRLENGSAANQLYSAAIQYLYPKSDFINIYETEKDILESTDYQKILEYYPALLDSSRYTIIVTGNFPSDIELIMNDTLGQLSNQKGKINIATGTNNLTESKAINVQITHTFLTDIPAEKAGPMPAILIPTTEFLDPVMYIFNSPKKGTEEEALFNALLEYIGNQLQIEINKNSRLKGSTVNINHSKPQMDTAGLTIMNVPHTKEIDSAIKTTIQNIRKNLKSEKASEIIQEIKDLWVQTELRQSYTNTGTAELLQKGLEYFPYLIKPQYYLEEYNFIQTATVESFLDALSLFPELPYLRVYSREGKK